MSCFSMIFSCINPKYNKSQSLVALTDQTISNPNIPPLQSKSPTKALVHYTTISNLTSTTKRPQSFKKKSFLSNLNLHKDVITFPYEEPDYIPSSLQTSLLTPIEIKSAGMIQLEVIDGDIIQDKGPIVIKANDIIYFYANNNICNNCQQGTKKAILNYNNTQIGNDNYLFVVFYVKELNQYKIKFNSCVITAIRDEIFIKIPSSFSYPIKSKEYLTIGKSRVELTPQKNDSLEAHLPLTKKRIIFPSQMKQSLITLGRDPKCLIAFTKDTTISKYNTIIFYDLIQHSWMIKDGSDEKASLNGSWIMGSSSYQIYSEMIIVIGNSKFKFVKYT